MSKQTTLDFLIKRIPLRTVKQENKLRVDAALRAMLSSKMGTAVLPRDSDYTYNKIPGGPGYGEAMLHWMAMGVEKSPEVRPGYEYYIRPVDYGYDFAVGEHLIEVKVWDSSTGGIFHGFSSSQLRIATVLAVYNPKDYMAKFSHPNVRNSFKFHIPPYSYLFISLK